ncbi:FAD-binding monooxygenase [Mycolicibacterium madagascariense]|uniref:FAD-binding monooxygenase n=1 Tax=Mycolicibacterium madagascariense TaxID=212765 RepID=A0A7I7XG26_9MYCO|nr:FAD-dependent monooxygenase [Mycolicibacterium madagascariense]MCV7014747.1 FAD-dependent monooxygenase [Mycolicibacterium madagascariense]BBZ28139.1 FAD-binding monooxygenase [Mycolicibacterium madagascariense]
MPRHAVISGAGIAGPALAHQLAARGWQTTVVERFPQRRDEGQNVDVRGSAREVVRRMGIEDDVRAANTGEIGMRFLDADGRPAATFPMNAPGQTDGPTAELEILRGELSRILIEHSRERTEYRFDCRIVDLVDDGERVAVTLDDGTALDADLVVIAEGLRSRSRRFVTSADVTDLGMYFAYVTIAREDSDEPWWDWQHVSESRAVHTRPDNLGTTRTILTFISEVRGLEDLHRDDQVAILRRTFADVGGAAPRILAALEDGAPLYFSAVGQVNAPVWSKGRIALLGDAAFCPATFGGGGTSLALIGAYVLAGELGSTDDLRTALANYERFMGAHVAASRTVHIGMLRRMNPRTRLGIRTLHGLARIVASPVVRTAMSVVGKTLVHVSADDLRLPDYPQVAVAEGGAR